MSLKVAYDRIMAPDGRSGHFFFQILYVLGGAGSINNSTTILRWANNSGFNVKKDSSSACAEFGLIQLYLALKCQLDLS